MFARPRAVAAVTLTALLPLAHVALSASPADAAAKPHAVAHLSSSADLVKPGQRVQLSGSLTLQGRSLSGRTVRVQKRLHGAHAWTNLQSARTDAHGRVAVTTMRMTRSEDYRLQWTGTSAVPGTTSAAVAVTTSQSVAITAVSDLHPTAGDIVTLTGSAASGIADRIAYLQLLSGSGWTSVASVRVPDDGGFTLTVRSMRAGVQQYRVLVHGGPGVEDAVSATQVFEVYAWFRLTDLTPLGSTSVFGGPQTIGGVTYAQSLGATLAPDQSIYTEYDLDYRCRLLRTTIGPADGADSDFSALFTAKVDDARPVEVVQAAGTSQYLTAEISGGQTMRLTSFAESGSGTAVWGNAEVLCLGTP